MFEKGPFGSIHVLTHFESPHECNEENATPPCITPSACVCWRRTRVHTRNAWECVPVYKLIFIKSVQRRKKMQCYSQRICLAFDWVVVLFRGAKVASDLINKHEEMRKCSQAFAASSANMSA